jgi:hypothetical protein
MPIIERGASSLLLAIHAALQAGLFLLLVRVMGKSALTSCD